MTIEDRDGILAAELAMVRAHLDGLPLPPEGKTWVLERFSTAQARPTKGTQRSLASMTNRQKSSLSNETDSYFEYNHLFIVDADAATVSFRTQAFAVTIHPEEPRPDGTVKRHGFQIYPDVLIVELGRVVARDLMREEELIAIHADRPWFIFRDPDTGRWICPSAAAALADLGIEYEIISSATHSSLHARTCRYLADHIFNEIASSTREEIVALVRSTPGVSIDELITDGESEAKWTSDDVLGLVAQRVVFLDIENVAADVQNHARLYADSATGRAYASAHPPSWAPVGAVTVRASVAPDTMYALGTRSLKLFVCLGDEVLFTSVDQVGCPVVSMTRGEFEQRVASGVLVPSESTSLIDQARAGALAAWQAADREAQQTAMDRWRALEIWRANREARRNGGTILPIPLVHKKSPSQRTFERWDAASLESDRLYGDHLVGMLPKPRRGRPGDRLSPAVRAICDEAITAYWAKPVGRSKKALVRRIRLACEKAGIKDLPDGKSIVRLINKCDPYVMARAHDGDKAAYKLRPYLPVDPDATPVHGLYPFQRVHYDTTTTDIETIDPLSGRNLGRPTLGYLIDGYSDRELARGWTYDGPTAYDVLQALVMCAERWGRLPEELILDHAITHFAIALKVFCTIHRIDITYRPKSQARFGGPAELAFKRITDELLHQCRGNTKAMKLVRQVTAAVDARRQAILSLPDLDYLMDLWVEKVEDARIVQRLGKTVRTAFEEGLIQHGRRESRRVVVDELFQMHALEPEGTRIANGPIGVFVGYLYYRHDCFRCHGVKRKQIEIKSDPRNVTRVFAFIPAHYHGAERIEAGWAVAINYLLRAVRVVSSAELAIASTQAKARLEDDSRKRVGMERAIAEVLLATEAREDLNLERLRTAALQTVRQSPATRAVTWFVEEAAASTDSQGDDDLGKPSATADPMAGLGTSIEDDYFRKYQEAS